MGSKATSTTKQYLSEWSRWESWASKHGIPVYPASPFHFALYITHLRESGAKSSAVRASAAAKFVHDLAGLCSPCDNPMVRLALDGHKRATATPTVRKEPISPEILRKIYDMYGKPDAGLWNLRTLFVIFISYAGFLRFDDLINISRGDCLISDQCLTIRLRKAKNDQFRQVAEVCLRYLRVQLPLPSVTFPF